MISKSFIALLILAGSLTSFVNAAAISPTRRIAARQNYDLPARGATSNSKNGSGNGGLGPVINTVLPPGNAQAVGKSTEDIDIELAIALKVQPDGAIKLQVSTIQPIATQSGASQSNATQPGAIQSGATQPQPSATQSQPSATQPQSSATQSNPTQPAATATAPTTAIPVAVTSVIT